MKFLYLIGILFIVSLSIHSIECVWPQPQVLQSGVDTLPVSSSFSISSPSSSTILQNAIKRYSLLMFPFGAPRPSSSSPQLTQLTVSVSSSSEDLFLGVDESYNISVSSSGVASIAAATVYGAMHGLETFSQLLLDSSRTTPVNSYFLPGVPLFVSDFPRFPWRGLLVDTARHFLDVPTLKRAIDGLSFAKLNVLHWHTVDAQSFPIVSSSFPRLSQGAYAPAATFSHADVSDVVQYAKARGVRVVAEFDIPGHAASWGVGYPNLTAVCPSSLAGNINNVPLDPTQPFTYQVLAGLFGEMTQQGLFTDQYLHVGGDELVTSCWTQDPAIAAWMKANGMTTGTQLEQFFETKLMGILAGLGKTPVFWQEVFQAGITGLPSDSIFEVWKDHPTLQSVITSGYRGIYAAGNYLDQQIPNPNQTWYEWVDTWKNFYANDPYTGINASPSQLANIIGGEAAMWGEQVDSVNFDSRVWPRASAVAERLWSDRSVNDVTTATPRLAAFRCTSLAQRGIGAGPISPGYCPLPQQSPLPHSARF